MLCCLLPCLRNKNFNCCHGYLNTVVAVAKPRDIQTGKIQPTRNGVYFHFAYRQAALYSLCVDSFRSRYCNRYVYLHVPLEVPDLQYVDQSAQAAAGNGVLHGLLRSLAYILTMEIRAETEFDDKPSQLNTTSFVFKFNLIIKSGLIVQSFYLSVKYFCLSFRVNRSKSISQKRRNMV